MVNNYLFDKKLIIYLKKKITDSFDLLKDIPNLNNEKTAKNILKNLNFISNRICRLKIYFNEKFFMDNFINQINLVRYQIENYKYEALTLKNLESIETSIKDANKDYLERNKFFQIVNKKYEKIKEDIKRIFEENKNIEEE